MPNRSDRLTIPTASTNISPPPVDHYAAWRRPSGLCRSLFVGLALTLPGGLFGALLGLVTGTFTLGILAGGLLAAVAGATLEARSSVPPLSPSRRSDSNTNTR
ncbi:hypothetical protein [Planctomyces sp. SH-PL14]|uniref:hypothetical protein n=1 Tax=Planctomyces sp. SH-PL14 TaxID=1632864 RepID=UPI00078BFD34|nr:hypothetical protein [Planctomyces sp. SH-PL14]AMV19450.1 hypothetical protein VT03_16270 [Planctomyces sp. SH-PL14]